MAGSAGVLLREIRYDIVADSTNEMTSAVAASTFASLNVDAYGATGGLFSFSPSADVELKTR